MNRTPDTIPNPVNWPRITVDDLCFEDEDPTHPRPEYDIAIPYRLSHEAGLPLSDVPPAGFVS